MSLFTTLSFRPAIYLRLSYKGTTDKNSMYFFSALINSRLFKWSVKKILLRDGIAKCELINPLVKLSSAFLWPNHLCLQRSKGCRKYQKNKTKTRGYILFVCLGHEDPLSLQLLRVPRIKQCKYPLCTTVLQYRF